MRISRTKREHLEHEKTDSEGEHGHKENDANQTSLRGKHTVKPAVDAAAKPTIDHDARARRRSAAKKHEEKGHAGGEGAPRIIPAKDRKLSRSKDEASHRPTDSHVPGRGRAGSRGKEDASHKVTGSHVGRERKGSHKEDASKVADSTHKTRERKGSHGKEAGTTRTRTASHGKDDGHTATEPHGTRRARTASHGKDDGHKATDPHSTSRARTASHGKEDGHRARKASHGTAATSEKRTGFAAKRASTVATPTADEKRKDFKQRATSVTSQSSQPTSKPRYLELLSSLVNTHHVVGGPSILKKVIKFFSKTSFLQGKTTAEQFYTYMLQIPLIHYMSLSFAQ